MGGTKDGYLLKASIRLRKAEKKALLSGSQGHEELRCYIFFNISGNAMWGIILQRTKVHLSCFQIEIPKVVFCGVQRLKCGYLHERFRGISLVSAKPYRSVRNNARYPASHTGKFDALFGTYANRNPPLSGVPYRAQPLEIPLPKTFHRKVKTGCLTHRNQSTFHYFLQGLEKVQHFISSRPRGADESAFSQRFTAILRLSKKHIYVPFHPSLPHILSHVCQAFNT